MPGRQAHGRSLQSAPKATNSKKKSKARAQKNALDAFGIAQDHFAAKVKKTPRARQLDIEVDRKHGRDDDDDEEDEDDEDMPPQKKSRSTRPAANDNADYGSDSEGNEWVVGGMRDDDEDSEIESDDAFGESDGDQFDGYAFRGSKSKPKDESDSDDSDDDMGETLGEDAIDLATALDQWESESEDGAGKADGALSSSGDDDSEESDGDSEQDESDSDDDQDEEDDDEADPEQLKKLRGVISAFAGEDEDDAKAPVKQKIGLGDLGLSGIDDPFLKNSLKLMNKEAKEKRPGATKKLIVPLAKREQDRLDRSAAYDKTNETLDRWTETVKQNRRAEHLMFPLKAKDGNAGLDTTEIQPLSAANTTNELEATIMSIMDQSGLSMEKQSKPKEKVYDDEGNELTKKEIMAKKRIERELNSREQKRAARIKKIKSKAYHRVHRKEKERNDVAAREAMEEAGEIDSEEEREAQDRRRALERVGQRHKDSKWAKLGNRAKRAVWDEDFRAGLTEMARKDEELRRRKEGKRGGEDEEDSDDTSSSGSDSEDDGGGSGAARLRRKLEELERENDEPQSGLMGMKFMQKAEAARKKENDELIQQIRRELDGEDSGDDDMNGNDVGRRQYGTSGAQDTFTTALDTSKRISKKPRDQDLITGNNNDVVITTSKTKQPAASNTTESTANTTVGAWSRDAEVRRKKKTSTRVEDIDLNASIIVASRSNKKTTTKPSTTITTTSGNDDDNDSDSDNHLPLAIRDQEMVARAFAGEDVFAEFEREKEEVAEADDDKVIDNTLPGWGSWVGDGVSKKELNRHKGRFLTKIDGVKKDKRKDAKLDRVIMNEKRVKKNEKYLASQLPHPFESREQYERSLRLPVGPEWQTKETFQDGTKPRVIIKQGIIAPMSKPSI